MARPKQYPRAIRVRLTEDEYARLNERAKVVGVSLSRYLAENGLATEVFTAEEREHRAAAVERLERSINEVSRVGNSLNQIAHQLNAQRGTLSLARIEQVLTATRESILELYRRLNPVRKPSE
jgi:mobilization protein NikA